MKPGTVISDPSLFVTHPLSVLAEKASDAHPLVELAGGMERLCLVEIYQGSEET